MSDEKPRRSRTAWPGPMSIAGLEPGHDHQLPAPLVQRTRLLTRAVVIFGVCLAAIGTLLVLLILERSEQRDQEQAESKRQSAEQTRQTACAILEALPVGPLLDSLRAQFECGPGIPLDQLPPAVREQLRPAVAQSQPVTPAPTTPAPPLRPSGGPAVVEGPEPSPVPQDPQAAPVGPPPPAPTPAPSPDPVPPLVDLNPITEPICEALGVCF